MLKKTITICGCVFALFITSACSQQTVEKTVDRSNDSEKTEKVNTDENNEENSEKPTPNLKTTKPKDVSAESANDGKVYTPKKGSKDRKAIFDALRIPVEKELKQKIVFAPDEFKVFRDWVFVGGKPLTKAGKTPNYKGTIYEADVTEGAFDNNFFALLKKTEGRWKVIKYYIGCTDVCYLEWHKEYNAPKEIFPYTEE